MTTIPLAPPLLTGSSNRPGSIRRAVLLPYLVLLRAGFCLPPMLPPARCALTAPFHPYPPSLASLSVGELRRASPGGPAHRSAKREGGRYIFCATFLQVALTGR